MRKWLSPHEGAGMPDRFQIVWIRRGFKPRITLGCLDPNVGIWFEVNASGMCAMSQDVTHWLPLEPAPALLPAPDEALLLATRMAVMLERVMQIMPEPWESLDLAAMTECIEATRRLRRRK